MPHYVRFAIRQSSSGMMRWQIATYLQRMFVRNTATLAVLGLNIRREPLSTFGQLSGIP
jgi:hypothetical protein